MEKLIVVARILGMGLLGWMFPRILIGMGVPLEEWAESLGSLFAGAESAIRTGTALNILGICLAIFAMTLELWGRPIGRAIDLYKNRKLSARYIPLNEAATSLYGSLREFDKEHLHIKLSQTFDDKPNGIADYFAIFISQNADIYGKRPPSIILEKIDPNEWSKGSFVEGGKAFSYYQKDQSEYIDLVVKSNELPGLLDILKSQTSIDYGPAPE